MRPAPFEESGISLVAVLLATGFFSTVALGLALLVSTSLRADSNYRHAVTMLNAAEAALELAAHDLALEADWNLVLSGVAHSAFTDGAPSGTKAVPIGGIVNLSAQTNLLNCGLASACTVAQMDAASLDRLGTEQSALAALLVWTAARCGSVHARGSALRDRVGWRRWE